MCDTLGFVGKTKSIFGKNSDRSPNEPQLLEFIPAAEHSETEIALTYISIPQVKHTNAILISRPSWMWGAEIGVNEYGVCIGNEAVWTLGKYGKDSLTGMDMLRIALERSNSAEIALDTITSLLEKYGQGGNCGYDHDFHYDNSFLIMDRHSLFVLETAGWKWAVKKMNRASISNRLSLKGNADRYSHKRCNFSLINSDPVFNIGSGSLQRLCRTSSCISQAQTVEDFSSALRSHNNVTNPFAEDSVTSVCMHYGGLVGDHTTSSMIVELTDDGITVWSTACSTPCISLYKPWIFGSELPKYINCGSSYWYRHEMFHRGLIGTVLPQEYYDELNMLETRWHHLINHGHTDICTYCCDAEEEFLSKWEEYSFAHANVSKSFTKRWTEKTDILKSEIIT